MANCYAFGVMEGTVTSLKTFALICARWLGPGISQRDEPASEPLKPVDDKKHRADISRRECEIEEWHAERRALLSLSVTEIAEAALAFNQKQRKSAEESIVNYNTKLRRYQNMRQKVVAWQASEEYAGLRAQMLCELDAAAEWDSILSPPPSLPEMRTPQEWHNEQIAHCDEMISHCERMLALEKKRLCSIRANNEWVTELWKELDRAEKTITK